MYTFSEDFLDVLSIPYEELKCENKKLYMANWQNAHNFNFAVNQVINLYRKILRQHKFHPKILAFSILYCQKAVRINSHYPVLDEDKTSVYCLIIKKFDIISKKTKDKCTDFIFTKNIYGIFNLIHFDKFFFTPDQFLDLWFPQHLSNHLGFRLVPKLNKKESYLNILSLQTIYYQQCFLSLPSHYSKAKLQAVLKKIGETLIILK